MLQLRSLANHVLLDKCYVESARDRTCTIEALLRLIRTDPLPRTSHCRIFAAQNPLPQGPHTDGHDTVAVAMAAIIVATDIPTVKAYINITNLTIATVTMVNAKAMMTAAYSC